MSKKEGYFPQFLRDISIERKLEVRIGELDFHWKAYGLLENFGREEVEIKNKYGERFFISLSTSSDESSQTIFPGDDIIINILDKDLEPWSIVELRPNGDCLIENSDMEKRKLTNREKIHLRGFFTCLEEKLKEKAEEKRNEEPEKITPEDVVDVFWPDGLTPF